MINSNSKSFFLTKIASALLLSSCAMHAANAIEVQSVTASADDGNIPVNAVDGDPNTRWSAIGDGQFITFDLGSNNTVVNVDVAFFKGDQREALIDILTSTDNSSWRTVFTGTQPNSSVDLQAFDVNDSIARYVKIVGHGNTINSWNSITEVEIDGSVDPVDPDPIDPDPIDPEPTSGIISVTASASANDGNGPNNTLDNTLDTRWSANGDGQWIAYDMGATHTVEELQIAFFKGDQRDANIDIQISSDNSTWINIWTGTQPLSTLEQMSFNVADTAGQYVRVLGHGNSSNSWNSITELDVIGSAGGTVDPVDPDPIDPDPVDPDPTANVLTVGPGETYSTIQSAINAITQVDTTVLIKAGTYNEQIELDKCGSSAGYIVIQGEEGAVMSGSSGNAFYLENCSYVKIRGLEITGYHQGVEVAEGSDNIYIEDNYMHHVGDSSNSLVVYVHGGGSEDPNENIYILNNELSYNNTGNSEVLTVNGNVDGFLIQGNYVHHNNNIGIDVIGHEGNGPDGFDQARNGIISDNRVEYISTEGGPGFDRNPTYSKGDYSADCIYVDGGKDIIIERNIVENCDLGIELASEHQGKNTENIIVRNNFVSNSYQGNITMGGYDSGRGNAVNIEVYNNTTYNGADAEILVQYNTSNVTIKNNIFYGKSGVPYLSNIGSNNSGFTVNNNIYYGASNSAEGSWNDSNPLFVNPQLSNVGSLDLHINSGSPAINAGVAISGYDFLNMPLGGNFDIDSVDRTNGTVDIGADER